jgi:hypothetical protein
VETSIIANPSGTNSELQVLAVGTVTVLVAFDVLDVGNLTAENESE